MPVEYAGHVNGKGMLSRTLGDIQLIFFDEKQGRCILEFDTSIDNAVIVALPRAEHDDFGVSNIAVGRGRNGSGDLDGRVAIFRFTPNASGLQGFDFLVFRSNQSNAPHTAANAP